MKMNILRGYGWYQQYEASTRKHKEELNWVLDMKYVIAEMNKTIDKIHNKKNKGDE